MVESAVQNLFKQLGAKTGQKRERVVHDKRKDGGDLKGGESDEISVDGNSIFPGTRCQQVLIRCGSCPPTKGNHNPPKLIL